MTARLLARLRTFRLALFAVALFGLGARARAEEPPPFPTGETTHRLLVELGQGALLRTDTSPLYTASLRGNFQWLLAHRAVTLGPSLAVAFQNPGAEAFLGGRANVRLFSAPRLGGMKLADLRLGAEGLWGTSRREQVAGYLTLDTDAVTLSVRAARDLKRNETAVELLVGFYFFSKAPSTTFPPR